MGLLDATLNRRELKNNIFFLNQRLDAEILFFRGVELSPWSGPALIVGKMPPSMCCFPPVATWAVSPRFLPQPGATLLGRGCEAASLPALRSGFPTSKMEIRNVVLSLRLSFLPLGVERLTERANDPAEPRRAHL